MIRTVEIFCVSICFTESYPDSYFQYENSHAMKKSAIHLQKSNIIFIKSADALLTNVRRFAVQI